MNSDDLPSYPTPQQATYSVPPQASSRRNAKPHPVSPAAYNNMNSNNNNMNPHANSGPPQHHEYQYHAARTYHSQSQPHLPQKQYYQHPPQPSPAASHAAPHYHHQQNTYNNSMSQGYYQQPPQTVPVQTQAPAPVPVPVPVPASPAPPVPGSSGPAHYGSAPSQASFHKYMPQQQQQQQQHLPPAPHASGGTRSASYSSAQYSNSPSVPTSSPPALHTSAHAQGRAHVPGKKAPPGTTSRSREHVDETPKPSSKQRLEAELRATFDRVDANRSGKISARELSAALVNFDNTGFQHSTVRLMIKLFSPSGGASGLNFEQFVSLWKYLTAYKKLFVAADVNKSGDISFGEFQRIIEQIGYKLNVDLVLHLFQKFANKESYDDGSVAVGKLKFDAFIELLVYLRKLTDIFKQYDKSLTGVATIDYSDFLLEISNLT